MKLRHPRSKRTATPVPYTALFRSPQFSRAVRALSPQALIGLTATPHPTTDPAHIVFHYPLAETIADGYVKVPVLVARRDGSADIRRQLADGVILLKHKAAALAAYAAHTGEPAVDPVMFIVCSPIGGDTDGSAAGRARGWR